MPQDSDTQSVPVNKVFGFWGGILEFCDGPAYAISADGVLVAMHISSNQSFGKTDILRHKDKFDKMFPNGFEYEWVPMEERDNHAGLQKALELNRNPTNVKDQGADE